MVDSFRLDRHAPRAGFPASLAESPASGRHCSVIVKRTVTTEVTNQSRGQAVLQTPPSVTMRQVNLQIILAPIV